MKQNHPTNIIHNYKWTDYYNIIMIIKDYIRKFKIQAKKLYTIIAITIIEMVMLLWINNWIPTPTILVPLIQFVAIFEKRDVWSKLSEEEKEKIIISESEITGLIKGIEALLKEGHDVNTIIDKIKKV